MALCNLCIVVTVYGQLGYTPSYSGSHGDYAVVGCVKQRKQLRYVPFYGGSQQDQPQAARTSSKP